MSNFNFFLSAFLYFSNFLHWTWMNTVALFISGPLGREQYRQDSLCLESEKPEFMSQDPLSSPTCWMSFKMPNKSRDILPPWPWGMLWKGKTSGPWDLDLIPVPVTSMLSNFNHFESHFGPQKCRDDKPFLWGSFVGWQESLCKAPDAVPGTGEHPRTFSALFPPLTVIFKVPSTLINSLYFSNFSCLYKDRRLWPQFHVLREHLSWKPAPMHLYRCCWAHAPTHGRISGCEFPMMLSKAQGRSVLPGLLYGWQELNVPKLYVRHDKLPGSDRQSWAHPSLHSPPWACMLEGTGQLPKTWRAISFQCYESYNTSTLHGA